MALVYLRHHHHLYSPPPLKVFNPSTTPLPSNLWLPCKATAHPLRLSYRPTLVVSAGKEDTELKVSANEVAQDVSPEDLQCVNEIKRVLELLKKNRDMTFGEVKLTIMIEDPRDAERKRLLGIDTEDVTRDDLVAALEDVNEGRIPENRAALQLLAKELLEWPDIEVEVQTKGKPRKSLYAKATDTGVDPEVAAKRLNVDWDSAADIGPADEEDEIEVPAAVGYSALYLVTATPIIIVIAVVLILFYNSLQ